MAEGLLRALLPENSGWEAASAGICAGNGFPVSQNAVDALKEKGIDIADHLSTHLTPEQIEEADLLVTMTRRHRDTITAIAPESADKVFLLKSFGVAQSTADIDDPVGGDLEAYRHVRDEIDAALPDLILYLMEERNES